MDELNQGFAAEDRSSLDDIVTDADMWFENLQSVLDAGGCRLDLNVPEQTIRLAVFDIEDAGDDVHHITPRYAMDPQQRAVDIGSITEEEALSRQSAILPEAAVQELYQAAKEGRFFVRSADDSRHRQILVGENGLPRLGNPFEAPSEEDQLYQVAQQEPVIPEKPSRLTRRRAEAGDRDARYTVQDYDDAVADHQTWAESQTLRAAHPDKARIADAMVSVTTEYYMNMNNDGILPYSVMVSDIRRRYELSLLTPEEREYRAYAAETERQTGTLRDGILELKHAGRLPLDQPLSEEAAMLLAEKLACREEDRRVRAWDVARDGAIRPRTPEGIQLRAQELRDSPAFSEGLQRLTGKTLDRLLSVEPEKFGRELDRLRESIEAPAPEREARPQAQPEPEAEPEPAPTPAFSSLARQFRSLHDRLKQDDSRWNWRNSDQYDKLLTALENASDAFSRSEGYLDDAEQEALRQSVAEVTRRAEDYLEHIGDQGKNARQQRRLEMTEEVLALADSIIDPKDAFSWSRFAEGHNAQAREAYYQGVRDLTGRILAEDEINADRKLSPAEKYEQRELAQARQSLKRTEENYDAAVQRTEELRDRIERGQADPAKEYLTRVDTAVLKAREELTRMAARNTLDPKQLQTHIATVIAGTETHLVNLPDGKLGERFFEARRQLFETSPALTSMVRECAVKELTDFLTGPGEHRFTDRLKGRMASPLYAQQSPKQQERAPEAQKKQPERGGLIK